MLPPNPNLILIYILHQCSTIPSTVIHDIKFSLGKFYTLGPSVYCIYDFEESRVGINRMTIVMFKSGRLRTKNVET